MLWYSLQVAVVIESRNPRVAIPFDPSLTKDQTMARIKQFFSNNPMYRAPSSGQAQTNYAINRALNMLGRAQPGRASIIVSCFSKSSRYYS